MISVGGAESTFITYDGRYESLIDHIIIQVEKLQYPSFCEIKEDTALIVSRHRPVHCVLEIPSGLVDFLDDQIENLKINWRKIDQESISAYALQIENNERIRNQFFEGDLNSVNLIEHAYQTLVSEITVTAQKCFPVKTFKHFLQPYWNQELRDFHKRMTLKRAAWVADGKLRDSGCWSYKEYKNSKRIFRRCHRKYANKYLQNQLDQIDKAAEVDSSLFWRMINAR